MSLARLALRLAAVEALCPHATGATGPWPTIAGPNVYDSRLDPIAGAETPEQLESAVDGLDNKPIVILYTEEDDLHPYTQKYDADEQVATLVVELMIAAKGYIEIDPGPDANGNPQPPQRLGSIEAPVTDREHEAMLDMLEAQVRFALKKENRAPAAEAFRYVVMETRQVHSDPQRAHDRTVRLASRTVKYHLKLRKEVWPDPSAAGLARLPDPLRVVAGLMPASSSALTLCERLVTYAPTPVPTPAGPTPVALFARLSRAPAVDIAPTGSADADVASQPIVS